MMKVAGFSVLLTVMPLFPQPQRSGGNAPGCKPISDSVALQFEIEDSDSLKSDGKGPYRHNTDCIWAGIFIAGDAMLGSLRPGPPGVLSLPWDTECRGAKRTLHVNLDRPAPGSGAKPLGIIRATLIKLKIFYSFEGNSFHGLLDMPVGITARSPWTQISVDNVDLLFGSDPVDACGFRLDAPKTTSAKLTRRSDLEWVLDLPDGSIGQLNAFETFEQNFDKGTGGSRGQRTGGGLYQFSARIRITAIGPVIPLLNKR